VHHISRRDDSPAGMRLTTQTESPRWRTMGSMKENLLSLPRRPIAPKHRAELRGTRRHRAARRHSIRTRCGYLLFTRFV